MNITAELQQLENQVVQSQSPKAENTRNSRFLIPRADIFETANDIVVVADMPGVDETSVDITVEKNILTIHGASENHAPDGLSLSYAEFGLGDYQRRFTLPNEINKDGISAAMKNGVLKLILPKSAAAQLRRIAVKSQ